MSHDVRGCSYLSVKLFAADSPSHADAVRRTGWRGSGAARHFKSAQFDLRPLVSLSRTHISQPCKGIALSGGKRWGETQAGVRARLRARCTPCVSHRRQSATRSHSFSQLRVSVRPERVSGCVVSRLPFSRGAVCNILMGRGIDLYQHSTRRDGSQTHTVLTKLQSCI